MPRKPKLPRVTRATGWTAYENTRAGTVIRAEGEFVPVGYFEERPATKAEIAAEQAARAEKAERIDRIEEFRLRPEYQDAESIRATLELMEWHNHPLDRLTPEEWHTLRNKICGS